MASLFGSFEGRLAGGATAHDTPLTVEVYPTGDLCILWGGEKNPLTLQLCPYLSTNNHLKLVNNSPYRGKIISRTCRVPGLPA